MLLLKHILGFIFLGIAVSYYHQEDRILLSDVKSLSLQAGKYTTGFRNSPIPQLNCESGYCSYGPNNILCENMGYGDKGIVWKCTGYGMTPGYKLRYSNVGCEGYDSARDSHILKGSCGVFYAVDKDYSYTKPTTTTTTTVSNDRYSRYYTDYDYYYDYDTEYIAFLLYICVVFTMFGFISYVVIHRSSSYNDNYLWYYPWTWSWSNSWYRPWSRWDYGHYPSSYGTRVRTTTTTYGSGSDSCSTESTTSGNTVMR